MDDYSYLLNKVVTFTKDANTFEIPFEEGMKAQIVDIRSLDDNGQTITFVFDFREFKSYNIDHESKLYMTNEGHHKRLHELETYPSNGIITCNFPNDPDYVPFTVDDESATSAVAAIKPIPHKITIKYQSIVSMEIIEIIQNSYVGDGRLNPKEYGSFLTYKKDSVTYFIPVSKIISITIEPLEKGKRNSTKRQDTK